MSMMKVKNGKNDTKNTRQVFVGCFT